MIVDTEIGRCISDASSAFKFIMAGNAYLTLVSKKSGNRYTYRVNRSKDNEDQNTLFPTPAKKPATWFVSLLKGPDNTNDYVYLGVIQDNMFRLTRKSRMTSDSVPVKAFSWTFTKLAANTLPDDLEVWHHGRCGRCGRMLTVPESIERGIGPECVGKFVN
jgi:hypothetical protein